MGLGWSAASGLSCRVICSSSGKLVLPLKGSGDNRKSQGPEVPSQLNGHGCGLCGSGCRADWSPLMGRQELAEALRPSPPASSRMLGAVQRSTGDCTGWSYPGLQQGPTASLFAPGT